MFGHDNDDTNHGQNNQALTATEPANDGTLSLPQADDEITSPVVTPVDDDSETDEIVPIPPQTSTVASSEPEVPDQPKAADNADMLSIKQKALLELKPLVGHLE